MCSVVRSVIVFAVVLSVATAADITPAHPSLIGRDVAYWTELTPTESNARPSVRYGHSAVAAPRALIVTHGYYYDRRSAQPQWLSDTFAYEYDSNEWTRINGTTGANVGAPSARFGLSGVFIDGAIYIHGGDDGGNSKQAVSYEFALFDDTWRMRLTQKLSDSYWEPLTFTWDQQSLRRAGYTTATASTTIARAQHGAVAHDRYMLVMGGQIPSASGSGANATVSTNDLWYTALSSSSNIATWYFAPCTHPPPPRFGHSMAAVTDSNNTTHIYVYGGFSKGKPNFGDLWSVAVIFTPSQHITQCEWTLLSAESTLDHDSADATMMTPMGRAFSALIAMPQYLLMFGGAHCSPGCKCSAELWLFRLHTHTWSLVSTARSSSSSAPEHRYKHSMVVGQRHADDSNWIDVYIFGGESYDPQSYHNDLHRLQFALITNNVITRFIQRREVHERGSNEEFAYEHHHYHGDWIIDASLVLLLLAIVAIIVLVVYYFFYRTSLPSHRYKLK